MANISIKDVPDQWAETLRQRAARNHRSLQGELMAILEQAVQEPMAAARRAVGSQSPEAGATVVGVDRRGHAIVRNGWKTVEQVVAELSQKFPEPIADQMSSIDIIRQERDSR
jgi:plasmid stability protein